MTTNATQALAEFAVTADVGAGPRELRDYAVRAVVDTVAVAVAAGSEPAVRIVSTVFGAQGGGRATVWADGSKTNAANAALLNGTAAHALDYDDVAEAIHTHPSAVMVPALLNVAEETNATGRQIVDAWVVGYEVQSALGAGMDLDRHFGRGWHGTTSIAPLGGAAAVGRLLGLDVDEMRAAIAIAASMAGGSRQNFGTQTKPFHAGLAARDSVLAARLAQAGLTADPSQVEGKLGYLTNFGDGPEGAARVVEEISRPWLLLRTPLDIKPYPCCYRAARTADAAIQLSARTDLDPERVARVSITMEPRGTAPLIHHRPQTGLQGKFSAEYVFAAGLVDGRVALESFTDAAVQRPLVQSLLSKVAVAEAAVPPAGDLEWEDGYAVVDVELDDGRVFSTRVDIPHGHDHDPLTDAEVDEKLRQCLRFAGRGGESEGMLVTLRNIDSDQPFAGI